MRTYPRSILKKLSDETSYSNHTKAVSFVDEATGKSKKLATVFEFEYILDPKIDRNLPYNSRLI